MKKITAEHVAYGFLVVGGLFLAAELIAGFQAKSLNGTLPSWFLNSFGKVENYSPGPLGAGGNLLLIGAAILIYEKKFAAK